MKLSNKIIIILTLVLLFFIGYSVHLSNKNKNLELKNKQNIEALVGMETLQLKNGQLIAERAAFVMKKDELEKQSAFLAEQLKLLEKKKNKVKVIVKTEIEYVSPVIDINNNLVKINDTTYHLTFNEKTDTAHLSGYSEFSIKTDTNSYSIMPGRTIIDTNTFRLDLIYGIKEKNGIQRVFATSTNPNIRFNDMEGYILERPKNEGKDRFNFGIQTGIGYLPIQRTFGPYIGVGVQYNIRLKN